MSWRNLLPWNWRNEESGCTGHHYSDWTETNDISVKGEHILNGGAYIDKSTKYIFIKRKKKKQCQHEGCNEEKHEWHTISEMRVDDFIEFVENKDAERYWEETI